MSNPPVASIIVANYNYARFLREAIDSALNQTYPRTEVIVVDDGSTDGSREIIASYGNRIMPVLKQNGGHNSALNAGFYQSRGEVIFFLDSDDALLPTAAEVAAKALSESNVAKVHWPVVEMDGSSRQTGRIWGTDHRGPSTPEQGFLCGNGKTPVTVESELLPEADMRELLLREGPDAVPYPPTSGNAFARKFLDTVFPLPTLRDRIDSDSSDPETGWISNSGPICYPADVYLASLAALYGRIKRVAEPQTFYRVHGQNGYSSLKFEDRLRFDLAIFNHTSRGAVEYCNRLNVSVDPEVWKSKSWAHRIYRAIADIAQQVPCGASFILVDEDAWGTDPSLGGRERIPFLERDGQYWGRPADDAAAIRELGRLRKAGAQFIVFAWSTFWWFDYYIGLRQYLCTRFPCILENDSIVMFDLRREVVSA